MLKGTDLLRELVSRVKYTATGQNFHNFTRERVNQISADILRVKLQIHETVASWPRSEDEDDNLIQIEWTLNCLLNNLQELLLLPGLRSDSRKGLIKKQLTDFEEHLNALDRVFQRQSDPIPLSPDQYHVVFPDNHTESFNEENELIEFLLMTRNKDPKCGVYTVYPQRCRDGLLLTEIGGDDHLGTERNGS